MVGKLSGEGSPKRQPWIMVDGIAPGGPSQADRMYRRLMSNGGFLTPSSRPGIKANRSFCARHILGEILQAVDLQTCRNIHKSLRHYNITNFESSQDRNTGDAEGPAKLIRCILHKHVEEREPN